MLKRTLSGANLVVEGVSLLAVSLLLSNVQIIRIENSTEPYHWGHLLSLAAAPVAFAFAAVAWYWLLRALESVERVSNSLVRALSLFASMCIAFTAEALGNYVYAPPSPGVFRVSAALWFFGWLITGIGFLLVMRLANQTMMISSAQNADQMIDETIE